MSFKGKIKFKKNYLNLRKTKSETVKIYFYKETNNFTVSCNLHYSDSIGSFKLYEFKALSKKY